MPGRPYTFAGFELDEQRFELRRGGVPVHLPPKAMDLLLLLVRHRDRVLTKEELLARLWPGTTVTEASLVKALGAARRALGDTATEQRYIRTVHGRGLRFVAPLDDVPRDGAAGPASHPEPDAAFVGRDNVLAAIAGAVAAADTGSGRLVLLAGEPGIGKTRTAQEAARRRRGAGGDVLAGWCHDGEGAPGLWPWLQVIRQLVTERDLAPLIAGLEEGLADLAALVPALGERVMVRHPPASLDPQQARFRLFDTVVELLRRAAAERAQLIVLDDLHGADTASLDLLGILTRALPESRIAVLATYRHEEVPAGSPLLGLARRPGCVQLGLGGLARAEVARLAEIAVGEPVPAAVVDRLHERTEGNPFFVTELARALAAAGRLCAATAADLPLPAGVREVLRQRLDRLSPACRRVLAVGAAIGPEFDLGLLARAAGEGAERVLELVDEACEAHVVREQAPARYRCAHALVREALLEQVAAAERARLHRRVGEALEVHHQGDLESHLAELAHHFCAGAPSGVAHKAVEYARRAGDRAADHLAHDEAADHYRRALEAQMLLAEPSEHERCELLLALGGLLLRAGRTRQGRAVLRGAADHARRLNSPQALGRVALAAGGLTLSPEVGVHDPELIALLGEALELLPETEGALRVHLLARLGFALQWSPAPARSIQVAEEAVRLARRVGDPLALGSALYGYRWSLRGPGECGQKLAISDEILRLAQEAPHRELELAGRASRLQALIECGRVAEADAELAAYQRLATELRVPRYRWRALFYGAMRAFLAGRLGESEELAQRAQGAEQQYMPGDAGQVFGIQMLMLRREQDRLAEVEPALALLAERFPALPSLRATQALVAAELGREAEGRRGLEALATPELPTFPRDFLWLSSVAVLAELCALLGDAARARMLYTVLRPYAPRAVMIGAGTACLGAVDRYLGMVAATAGDLAGAARHLAAARAMDAHMDAGPWLAWTELELARLRARGRRGRDRAESRAHLERARGIAAPLGMTRLLRHAAALADRLA